jgi:hypothetical protein
MSLKFFRTVLVLFCVVMLSSFSALLAQVCSVNSLTLGQFSGTVYFGAGGYTYGGSSTLSFKCSNGNSPAGCSVCVYSELYVNTLGFYVYSANCAPYAVDVLCGVNWNGDAQATYTGLTCGSTYKAYIYVMASPPTGCPTDDGDYTLSSYQIFVAQIPGTGC